MNIDLDSLIQPLIGLGVCFFIFLLFYSKYKKQTIPESIKELIETLKGFGGEEK